MPPPSVAAELPEIVLFSKSSVPPIADRPPPERRAEAAFVPAAWGLPLIETTPHERGSFPRHSVRFSTTFPCG